jgi:hypothetical protein
MATRKTAKRVRQNKTCREMTGLVLDYLTDKLTPAVKREFTKHLRLCPDCVSFLNTYKKTVAATGTIEPENVPSKVRESVLAFLRKRIYRAAKGLLLAIAQLSLFTVSRL